MLHGFPNKEFLENLQNCFAQDTARDALLSADADIANRGNEGVIVMTPESVIKIYGSSESKRGISAFTREQNALLALGGGEHEHFMIPELKSSQIFKESFNLLGVSYGAMTEQTRIRGEHPALETVEEQFKLGQALGEFHEFLRGKSDTDLISFPNLLGHRVRLLQEKQDYKPLLKPGARKQLVQDLLDTVSGRALMTVVHGDFRPGNFLWDGQAQKFGVLDLTTIGISLPEQDLAHLAHLPSEKLKNIFNGYRSVTDHRMNLATVQRLHLLDIAIAMNSAQSGGFNQAAEGFRKRFDAVWAKTYHKSQVIQPTTPLAKPPGP